MPDRFKENVEKINGQELVKGRIMNVSEKVGEYTIFFQLCLLCPAGEAGTSS